MLAILRQIGESFNQETTLCGHSIIKNIRIARKLGYFIDLNYVGIDSAKSAIQRVEQRVRDGGHGVPASDIERRYEETLCNLNTVICECDRVRLYGNSKSFRKQGYLQSGSPGVSEP